MCPGCFSTKGQTWRKSGTQSQRAFSLCGDGSLAAERKSFFMGNNGSVVGSGRKGVGGRRSAKSFIPIAVLSWGALETLRQLPPRGAVLREGDG